MGEADNNKHHWDYGWCELCDIKYPEDAECTHNWDDWGECVICGTECEHSSLDEGVKCTVCGYYCYAFSLTTGENVTFHETFADALDKASDGSVIKLLKDYSDYDSLGIDKAITLDLNGKEWAQPSLGSFTVNTNIRCPLCRSDFSRQTFKIPQTMKRLGNIIPVCQALIVDGLVCIFYLVDCFLISHFFSLKRHSPSGNA